MSDAQRPRNGDAGDRDRGGSPALPASDRLDLLASDRRRAVLDYLRDRAGATVRTETLVDHLASTGHGQRQSLAVALRHVHLPKFASAGVVEYDQRRGTVRYRRHERLERLLAFVDGE
ncbi:MAG: hypothetical protein ABEJ23_01195 [Haloarculaceae archaeon]